MQLWTIEARTADGRLDLSEPQPEKAFGMRAITGMTDDEIAKVVYRHMPDDVLTLRGDDIANWPKHIDARFVARRKTW